MSKLSPTMQHALDACAAAGGLWRWPGGWWVAQPSPDPKRVISPRAPSWGAQTIHALIDRKHVEVFERAGANQFAVAVRIPVPKVHYCRCCGEECPSGEDCCTDDFPEPGEIRETGK